MTVRRVLSRFLGGDEREGGAGAKGMSHGDLPFGGGWMETEQESHARADNNGRRLSQPR